MKRGAPLKLLLVEDSPVDAALVEQTLKNEGYAVDCLRVESPAEFVKAVKSQNWDIVIADYNLPEFDAPTALNMLRELGSDTPFIVVSGRIGEETAVSVMRLGASDYLMKDNLARLGPAVTRELAEAQFRRQRAKAESDLGESEARYRRLFNEATDGVVLADAVTGLIQDCNRAFLQLSGYEKGELVGRPQTVLFREDAHESAASSARQLARLQGKVIQVELLTKTRQVREVEVKANLVAFGAETLLQAFFRDVTEERRGRRERETTLALLQLLNHQNPTQELLHRLTGLLCNWTNCEAVGIRLQHNNDFPYFATRGFPEEFLRAERSLCATGQACGTSEGKCPSSPSLECFCGQVLLGGIGSGLPFHTPRGSFWTNDLSETLSSVPVSAIPATLRSGCTSGGFASVALIPLRHAGQTLGLLQLNDRVKGRFTPELIQFLESLADQVGMALSQRKAEVALRENEQRYRMLFNSANDAIFLHELTPIGTPGKFIEVNDVACNRLGYTRDELLQLSPVQIDAPDMVDWVTTLLPRLLDQQRHVFETVHLAKSGKRIPVEVSAHVIHYQERRVVLSIARDITERKQAEILRQALLAERDELLNRLQLIMAQMPIGCILTDPDFRITYLNPAACRIFAYDQLELLDRTVWETIAPEQGRHIVEQLRKRLSGTQSSTENVFENRTKDGRNILCSWHGAPVVDGKGSSTGYLALVEDVTGRKQMESQLRQAQKMEAIGQLAGGVAHDFNNILAAILMQLGVLQRSPSTSSDVRRVLKDLENGSLRATNLTRQLLLFSRQQVTCAKALDLNELISEILKMLERLLGENISIRFRRAPEDVWIHADAGMIEQVIMNLCINARDAMPKGGRLTISTSRVHYTEEQARTNPAARAGEFICLTVSDTGCGMDEETQQRIFEPFFTTKDVGMGTGLGLATVYGVVKQHQGWVEVESVVGQGSSFKVFLAPTTEVPESKTSASTSEEIPCGSEVVLLVEDEAAVRRPAALWLRKFGYAVLEASCAEAAVKLWQENASRIDLLLTDMIMPGETTGLELAMRLQKEKPSLRVIISSGYSATLVKMKASEHKHLTYLPKPYPPATLARVVRRCLDQAGT